ncbi:MAG: hypothetical protein Q9159_005016 [Coniocarpon cinnabarinum]
MSPSTASIFHHVHPRRDHEVALKHPKPEYPYKPRCDFSGVPYNPPKTHPEEDVIYDEDGHLEKQLQSTSQTPLTITLDNSPNLGHDDPTGKIKVHLEERLQHGDLHTAQIWRVRIDEAQPPLPHPDSNATILAKFFDPLYWDWDNNRNVHFFKQSENSFCREVACHRALEQAQGKLVPRFYGCFTVQVPTTGTGFLRTTLTGATGTKTHSIAGGASTRPVRVLLVEYIRGTPLDNLDWDADPKSPQHISSHARKAIALRIMEQDAEINLFDVAHGDLADRNIILVNGSYVQMRAPDWKPELRFIDFDRGGVGFISQGKYMNQLKNHWKKCLREQWSNYEELDEMVPGLLDGWIRDTSGSGDMTIDQIEGERKKRWKEWLETVFK